MPRERAKTFADRLPPVVPKVEDDISHLSDEMADVLYPGRRPRPFRVGVRFEPFEGPDYERALGLARRAAVYQDVTEDGVPLHQAAFETRQAGILRDLFQIVAGRPGTEVTVDGKRMPYATELWLPLMWMFVTQETR